MIALVVGVIMFGSATMFMQSTANYYYDHFTTPEIITIAVLCLVFGVPGLCGLILCFSRIVIFSANVIQFGLISSMIPQQRAPHCISIGMCGLIRWDCFYLGFLLLCLLVMTVNKCMSLTRYLAIVISVSEFLICI